MIITLTNDEKLNLSWNFLCMKYLDEYEGGYSQLENDIKKGNKNKIELSLFLCQAIIRSNYSQILTEDEALRLIPINEVDKIASFLKNQMDKNNNFKKKQIYHQKDHHKKK